MQWVFYDQALPDVRSTVRELNASTVGLCGDW